MLTKTKEPTVIQAGQGRKMNVLGHEITLKLSSQETDGEYYVFQVTTPPGHGIPPHVHQNEDEVIEVVEGEYEVQLGDQIQRVTAGGIFHFPRYIPHSFHNVGAQPGRTLWTVIPGLNFEQFFEEISALPANEPPDMGKVVAIFGKYGMEVLLPPPGI
jgi:quercetin dioxygenase-like cupin family protein